MKTLRNFVAIDPSVSEAGVCVVEDFQPVRVLRVSVPGKSRMSSRVRTMQKRILEALNPLSEQHYPRVIEYPSIHRDTPDPDNILTLVLVCGGLLSLDTELIRPREWKGTVPKEVKTGRIMAQIEAEYPEILEQMQRIPVSVRHNAADAVGLALWRLGKDWKKGRGP